MKKENKILIQTFFIVGTIFASGMLIFGYFNNDSHLFLKFIIHFILFGSVMGFLARKNYRKKEKENEAEE